MNRPLADTYDVIVVGYGYAGAVAALAAADAGSRVLLLEKAPAPGGISICSAGGLRIAENASQAFDYLKETCGGKTPDEVLRVFATGMTGVAERLKSLAAICDAAVECRQSPANYPFTGHETFGFAYVEDIPGFDPAIEYPHVRGSRQGALLFKVLSANVDARRDRIDVALDQAAGKLVDDDGAVSGIVLDDGTVIRSSSGVVLACGGFEADRELQSQYWAGGPALNAAYRHNTGDGIRMAQGLGADLWHMWHYHGSYGFTLPNADYPLGIRVKRLPDWQPGPVGAAIPDTPKMAWILIDQTGRRFMNEYEPYVQDTGARPLGTFDPATQNSPRNPAYLLVDSDGISMYPLGKPTRNDPDTEYEWSADNSREVECGLFRQSPDIPTLASLLGVAPAALESTIADWNAACSMGADRLFGRPPSSLSPLATPPYYAAPVYPIVSNTQGGPRHDAEQRVIDVFGNPIPGLYSAGECGSLFGHLYMSGGNLSECFVGGEIAGRNAARGQLKLERTIE